MCTLFAVRHGDEIVVGRNFDWIQRGGTIRFIPAAASYGSPTYGMCLVEQMGPDQPFEGINSQGLFIGLAAVPTDRLELIQRQSGRPSFDDLGIVRFILERAATTAEALALFQTFTLESCLKDFNFHLHHLIVDAQGAVAVYEEGYAVDIRHLSDQPWEAITNVSTHMDRSSCQRYQTVAAALQQGVLTDELAMDLLHQVESDITVWSTVYQLRTQRMTMCIDAEYDIVYRFTLNEQLQSGMATYPFTGLKLRNERYIERYRYVVQA